MNLPPEIARFAETWSQTTAEKNNLRSAPDLNAGIIDSLPANMPLKIKGVAGNWLRAELPAGNIGYIHQLIVKPLNDSIKEIVAAGKIIRTKPDAGSRAKKIITKNEKVLVYAEYSSYLLVDAGNTYGWIEAAS